MKKLLTFTYLFLFLLLPGGLKAQTDYEAYYAECEKAMQNADYVRVLDRTSEVLAGLPADSLDVRLECYSYLTGAYCRMGMYNEALIYADSCLTYDEQSGDPKNISSSLHNMACICIYLNLYEDAEHYLRRSIDLERQADPDETEDLAQHLGLLGEVYHLQGRSQMSLDTTLLAYRLDSIAGRESILPVRFSELGAAYYEVGLYDEATNYLSMAIPLLREDSTYTPLVICYLVQGAVYNKQHKLDQAFTYGKMALDIADSHNIRQQRLDAYELLSDVAPTLEERFDYLKKAYILKDSIQTDAVADRMTHLSSAYHLSEKDIVISKQLADLYNARIHRNYYILAIIGLSLLLLVICIYFQVRYLHFQRAKAMKAAVALAQKTKFENEVLSDENGKNNEKTLGHPVDSVTDQSATEAEDGPMKPKNAAAVKLTDRELEAIRLCCQGLSTKQIADKMCLSARTVEGYKRSAFSKLKVSSTVELVIYALHNDLL